MSYNTAVGFVLLIFAYCSFIGWYVNCLISIFYRCRKPSEFFALSYYPSPAFFILATTIIIVLFCAKVLQWIVG